MALYRIEAEIAALNARLVKSIAENMLLYFDNLQLKVCSDKERLKLLRVFLVNTLKNEEYLLARLPMADVPFETENNNKNHSSDGGKCQNGDTA